MTISAWLLEELEVYRALHREFIRD
jgi:hypothetical protein